VRQRTTKDVLRARIYTDYAKQTRLDYTYVTTTTHAL